MYNQNVMRAIDDINKTCLDPDRHEAELRALMDRHQAKTELVESLPNGINLYRILDKDGLIIGEYHDVAPVTNWGGSRPSSGRPAVEDKKIARSIKFSDAEWDTVKEKANAEGVSASEYVRKKVLK